MIIWTMGELSRLRDQGMLPTMRAKCFRCGDTLTTPCVVWSGGDADETGDETLIAMHPKCAEAVGADLVHDGSKAQEKGPR